MQLQIVQNDGFPLPKFKKKMYTSTKSTFQHFSSIGHKTKSLLKYSLNMHDKLIMQPKQVENKCYWHELSLKMLMPLFHSKNVQLYLLLNSLLKRFQNTTSESHKHDKQFDSSMISPKTNAIHLFT